MRPHPDRLLGSRLQLGTASLALAGVRRWKWLDLRNLEVPVHGDGAIELEHCLLDGAIFPENAAKGIVLKDCLVLNPQRPPVGWPYGRNWDIPARAGEILKQIENTDDAFAYNGLVEELLNGFLGKAEAGIAVMRALLHSDVLYVQLNALHWGHKLLFPALRDEAKSLYLSWLWSYLYGTTIYREVEVILRELLHSDAGAMRGAFELSVSKLYSNVPEEQLIAMELLGRYQDLEHDFEIELDLGRISALLSSENAQVRSMAFGILKDYFTYEVLIPGKDRATLQQCIEEALEAESGPRSVELKEIAQLVIPGA